MVVLILAMKGGLTNVKFKTTDGQAILCQMQVMGSGTEVSVLRREQLGIGMNEEAWLPEFTGAASDQLYVIDRIEISSRVGQVLQATTGAAIPAADRDVIVSRILSAAAVEGMIRRGDWLYSSPLTTSSTGTVIGAVVMAALQNPYIPTLSAMGQTIGWTYNVIILVALGLVLPVLIYAFRGFAALDDFLRDILSSLSQTLVHLPHDIAAATSKICAGHEIAHCIADRFDIANRESRAGRKS